MVGIENGDQVAVRMLQPVVEVAGFGMFVAVARQIFDIQIGAQPLELVMARDCGLRFQDFGRIALLQCAAIVEQPHFELVGRIIHRLGGGERVGQKIGIFVIGRNENIDAREILGFGSALGSWRQRSSNDEEAEHQHRHVVHFGEIEQQPGNEVFQLVYGRYRIGRAPIDIAQNDGRAESERHEPPCSLTLEDLDDRHQGDNHGAGNQLRLKVDRQRDQHDSA